MEPRKTTKANGTFFMRNLVNYDEVLEVLLGELPDLYTSISSGCLKAITDRVEA